MTAGELAFYDLAGKDSKGRNVEVEVSVLLGSVSKIETEIPMSKVPKVVLDALKAKAPEFQVKKAEEVKKFGDFFGYELEGTLEGRALEIQISPDGTQVDAAES